ncbi:DUF4421 family protein [Tamlana fucoidanivorans]|uniref:DUF4421 family protein n=1 Tax=Allotamlana fucoidanivorans TaxID=2583814 RepID=UPI0013053C42|nr:DUF4421 family protein [Tamlana fucoidanivorans]
MAQDSIAKSEYITGFPDKISARLSLVNTANIFFFADNDGEEYELRPNERDYLGASLLFRSVELAFGFSPKFLNTNKDNADSELFNLNFRMFYRQWMQTIDFYYQKGFSFSDNNFSSFYFPEIETLKLGGATSYIFNKKFSFRAIGYQNEKQNKSAGSFIPKLSLYYTKFFVNTDNLSERATSFDIAISPSYYYNFVLSNKLLFSAGASFGMGLSHSENVGAENINTILYELTGRVVLSYNSDSFFSGINTNISVLEKSIGNTNRQGDAISFIELYIGYRFKAPKKFMKWADDVNDFIGF